MNEVISIDDQFNNIVAGQDMTVAEIAGAPELVAPYPMGPDEPTAATTFETLARSPDAIRGNMTRLVVMNSTTDYTMPD